MPPRGISASSDRPLAHDGLTGGIDGLCRDSPGLGVQRARDGYLLARKFFGCLLVAEVVEGLTIVQNVKRPVRADTGNRTLGIVRTHAHTGMVAGRTHIVRDSAG